MSAYVHEEKLHEGPVRITSLHFFFHHSQVMNKWMKYSKWFLFHRFEVILNETERFSLELKLIYHLT